MRDRQGWHSVGPLARLSWSPYLRPQPNRRKPLSALKRLYDWPYLLLIFPPLCWAGNMVVGRAVRGEIPPLTLNWWRWSIAALVLLFFLRRDLWRQRHLLLKHWKLVVLLGLTGITAFHSSVYTGLTQTTAINAALIVAMGPVLIAPMARVIIGERLSGLQALGVAISCVGAVAVITRSDIEVLLGLTFNQGDLWLVFASFCWALYSVLLKLKPAEIEVAPLLMAIILAGAAMILPLFLWELGAGKVMLVSGANLAVLGYVSLFASVLAYLAWNPGVNAVGPNKAGLFLHLLPVFATLFAWLFLDERIEAYHLVGVPFIVAGIVLTTRFGARSPAVSSATAKTR